MSTDTSAVHTAIAELVRAEVERAVGDLLPGALAQVLDQRVSTERAGTGPRLLTIPETCQLLKRSRTRIYELMDSGELEYVKDGRSRLIVAESADAFLERLRRG